MAERLTPLVIDVGDGAVRLQLGDSGAAVQLGHPPPLEELARALGRLPALGPAADLAPAEAAATLALQLDTIVDASRALCREQSLDPAELALIPHHQAGLYATAIARRLGTRRVVVPALAPTAPAPHQEAATTGRRPVWFDDRPRDTALYDRAQLPPDAILRGPAILDHPTSPVAIEPGDRATLDTDGNLVIDVRLGKGK
ncbi:MAG: hypothetical protein EA356_08965 [Geminicoccaceae bacterium]|nr:MAG: hypothetical protein EA356_08965 [Geminicoccaceae bacterium]